jgi:hypothetical protein
MLIKESKQINLLQKTKMTSKKIPNNTYFGMKWKERTTFRYITDARFWHVTCFFCTIIHRILLQLFRRSFAEVDYTNNVLDEILFFRDVN